MAKKKRKSGRSSRRRVSGVGNTLTPILGAVLGAVGGKMLTKAVGGKVDPNLLAAGQILLAGFLIPQFLKGPMGMGVSFGMAGQAGVSLLSDMGVISGVSDFYRVPTINGMKKIAGSARQSLAGVELAKRSAADTRKYSPGNYNPATGAAQLNVISGFPSEYDEAAYNVD